MDDLNTGPLLDEIDYWEIVSKSLLDAPDQQSQLKNLMAILTGMAAKYILRFDLRTEELLFKAYTDQLSCAAAIMNRSSVTADSFVYFKTWLISRGKDIYYNALANPDSLVTQIEPALEWHEFELFRYAAGDATFKTTGEELQYYYPKNFAYAESKYPELKRPWLTANPNDKREVCPKLFDVVNKREKKLAHGQRRGRK